MTPERKVELCRACCLISTIAGIAGLLSLLSGCSVGRGDAGEIVVGMEVGRMVETFNQAAAYGSSFLPAPWGPIVSAVVATMTGVGGAWAANRARDKADAAFDEGTARAAVAVTPPVVTPTVTEAIAIELARKPRPIDPA